MTGALRSINPGALTLAREAPSLEAKRVLDLRFFGRARQPYPDKISGGNDPEPDRSNNDRY
jgi:hypothetical protein